MNLSLIRWLRVGDSTDDRVLAHAGRELARYIGRLTGAQPATRAGRRVEPGAGVGAAGHLRRTEPRFSPYIDTMLALRLAVESHR